MKRLSACIFILLSAWCVSAGQSSVQALSLESSVARFTVTSSSNAVYKVYQKWQIGTEQGRHAATFKVTSDSFRKLAAYSVTVTKDGKSRKISKSSFANVATGEAFVDDVYTTFYREETVKVPFTFEVEYTVNYKGFSFFPSFSPISYFGQGVESATFVLDLPPGMGISWQGNVDPVVEKGKRDVWTWSVKDVKPIKREHLMPHLEELMPLVEVHPLDFSLGGYDGSQRSWKDVGIWLTEVMKGCDDLSQDKIEACRAMTAGCSDDVDKVRTLYEYLGRNTRYVNISLGIGGYKPIPANRVADSGYGDCKALTNYMKNMLDAVGIKSYYSIVSTTTRTFPSKLHSAGLMDHAFLCVPLAGGADTLWLECTNPRIPFGYAHQSISGHQTLLLDGEDSRMVRVKSYQDAQRWQSEHITAKIDEDGSMNYSCVMSANLDYAEDFIGWRDWSKKTQDGVMTHGVNFMPEKMKLLSVEDNFGDYQKAGADFVPNVRMHHTMFAPSFARVQSDRIMIPASPVKTSVTAQRGTRVNKVYSTIIYAVRDTVDYVMPEGFFPEVVPHDVFVSCPWADYSSQYVMQGNVLRICREFRRSAKGTWPKEEYEEWRKFAKVVRLDREAVISLVRSR